MLENVDRIVSRMQHLENRLDVGPTVDSQAFQKFMEKPPAKPTDKPKASPQLAQQHLNNAGGFYNPSAYGMAQSEALNVQPLAQSNGISCGQTSVAMSINALTGKNLRDTDINERYGFSLLEALKSETAEKGINWKDGGEVSQSAWDLIDHKVNNEKTPVIVGLNGPEFSPSGRGHIVTIIKTEGDKVTFADPATGTTRTTTKQNMNSAPSHPDGNFIFYAERQLEGGPSVAANPTP